MGQHYDAIVLGAGHNGLVAANYLAAAGVGVLVLERRDFIGGACVTEELFPGFRAPTCSYVCHLLQDKVIEDLELRRHGFEVYPLQPYRLHPFPDGQYIMIWPDDKDTVEEIRRVAPRDAERFAGWSEFWQRAAGILHRYFLQAPPSLTTVAAAVAGTADEEIFERMLTGSMKDLVEEYFESDLVRATFIEAHDAGDVRAPGSIMAVAYIKCNYFTEARNVGIPHGGMGGITQAMGRAAQERGVEIRTGVEVERIAVRNGRAVGVILQGGEEIGADVVLSNADPKRTFLNLVEREVLEPSFIAAIKRLKTEVSCLKFHCALKELPDFSTYFGADFDPHYLAQVRICPSVAYFEQSWADARNGQPSSCPVMYVQIPSVYDESMTPPGQHIMSVWSLYAPVRLRQGTWDGVRQEVGEHLIDTLALYAPNVRQAIIDWQVFTPADLEARVYLTDGNIRHLDIVSEQMLGRRPNRELSGYRTPVEGLYLCGAGTHPGGEVTGAPGYNAAGVVLGDLGKG